MKKILGLDLGTNSIGGADAQGNGGRRRDAGCRAGPSGQRLHG